MKSFKLDAFSRGWICGDFYPSIIKNKNFEIGIRSYKKGEILDDHYHKELLELTVVVMGSISINGNTYSEDDIILIEKGEICHMEILSNNCKLVFIKTPSLPNDKFSI